MRTTNIIFILSILTLYSCKSNKNEHFEKDIVGDWIFIRTQDMRKSKSDKDLLPPLLPYFANGYDFNGDKSCENKNGYFKRIDGASWEDRKTIYLGNKTQYKIENGSLKILDLSDSTKKKQKIFSIINDTLTLQASDSLFLKYAKANYKLNPKETYDKIIVSSSGCFGTCPIMDISIDRTGEIVFWGERYNTENGFFSSRIKEEEFQKILTSFKKQVYKI